MHVAEVQISRGGLRVDVDRFAKHRGRRLRVAAPRRLGANLIAQESEDLLVLAVLLAIDVRDLRADPCGVGPLLLVLVQFLKVDQRVAVFRIELNDFLEGLEGPIDESAVTEVEAQAEQHIRVLQPRQIRAL